MPYLVNAVYIAVVRAGCYNGSFVISCSAGILAHCAVVDSNRVVAAAIFQAIQRAAIHEEVAGSGFATIKVYTGVIILGASDLAAVHRDDTIGHSHNVTAGNLNIIVDVQFCAVGQVDVATVTVALILHLFVEDLGSAVQIYRSSVSTDIAAVCITLAAGDSAAVHIEGAGIIDVAAAAITLAAGDGCAFVHIEGAFIGDVTAMSCGVTGVSAGCATGNSTAVQIQGACIIVSDHATIVAGNSAAAIDGAAVAFGVMNEQGAAVVIKYSRVFLRGNFVACQVDTECRTFGDGNLTGQRNITVQVVVTAGISRAVPGQVLLLFVDGAGAGFGTGNSDFGIAVGAVGAVLIGSVLTGLFGDVAAIGGQCSFVCAVSAAIIVVPDHKCAVSSFLSACAICQVIGRRFSRYAVVQCNSATSTINCINFTAVH